MRRHITWQLGMSLLALVGVVLGSMACSAQQAKWPSKPINLVVAFAPGGGADAVARVQAKYLSADLGQPINITNKGGGNQVPGVLSVLNAPPDGYTLLQELNTTSSLQTMVKDLPYKIEDRTYGPMMAAGPMAIVVPSSTPWNSLKDFVAAAKKDPSSITWGYLGGTSTADLTLMLLMQAGGVDISQTKPVTFAGSGPSVVAAAGGQVMLASDGAASVVPLKNAGKIKVLAVSGDKRMPVLPDVRTAAEEGFPSVNVLTWFAISGPKNLPTDILDRLDASAKKITQDPQFAKDMEGLGRSPQYMSPDQTRQYVLQEAKSFQEVYSKLPH